MTRPSPPQLRILHAVRLLGFADDAAIAGRAGVTLEEATSALGAAEAREWVQQFAFGGLGGWSLTERGRVENERQLSRERAGADPEHQIEAVYEHFLALNARLIRACVDWQLRPTAGDRLTPNDHTDAAWDERILTELATLSEALGPLIGRLCGVLARFGGYDTRFEAALRRARRGDLYWVDRTSVDSCHRVWFQLHEDLIATLGIDRDGSDGGRAS